LNLIAKLTLQWLSTTKFAVVEIWLQLCLDWRWVWPNHTGTVILLKLQSVRLLKSWCPSVILPISPPI